MAIQYILTRTLEGQQDRVIEITDKQLDLIYEGLRYVHEAIVDFGDELFTDLDAKALDSLFDNLYNLTKAD